MQVTFTHRAPGAVFAPDAFDSSIGKEIDVHLPDSTQATRGQLTAAVVAEDGSMVHLTVEVPDGTVTVPLIHISDMDVAADGTRTVRKFDFR